MSFGTTPILDNFDRTENPLSQGGAWTAPLVAGDATLSTAGNFAECFNGDSCNAYRTTPTAADCELYFTVSTSSVVNGDILLLWLRVTNPATAEEDEYTLVVTKDAGADIWQIYRGENLVGTQLGADFTQDISAGNRIGFGAIGNQLAAYYDNGSGWVQLATRTDSQWTTGGYIGFGIVEPIEAIFEIDNFGGGSVGSVAISGIEYSTFPKPKLMVEA